MKRLAIASLVGALILFIYLALAHAFLPVHDNDFRYTPAQDNISQVLSASNLEEGFYMVPTSPPGTSMKEKMKYMESVADRPGALINYYPMMGGEGASVLIMSFIYNLIAVIIVCIALAAASDKLPTFLQRLWFVMLFAFFVIFSELMLEYNWLRFPMHFLRGEIIDQIVGYLLVGIWLSWYYGKLAMKKTAS